MFRWSTTAQNSRWRHRSPTRSGAGCCATAFSIARRISTCINRAPSATSALRGCMFDNLIRRDPRDSGKTIVPDLAHSWEIAKDGKTYIFHLRQGVQFHDGTDFTSADIKATFDRIAKPPSGISIPRTPLFRAVSEINARDKYTVEFKLSAPRSVNFMMSAFASGWN